MRRTVRWGGGYSERMLVNWKRLSIFICERKDNITSPITHFFLLPPVLSFSAIPVSHWGSFQSKNKTEKNRHMWVRTGKGAHPWAWQRRSWSSPSCCWRRWMRVCGGSTEFPGSSWPGREVADFKESNWRVTLTVPYCSEENRKG